ncbi:thioredoxin domain-containing protein [Roseovarius salis]|uniref:DsbA family protein n=1 Tax=Roseovarius salis TaxID=3376063 RepID=UPI0037C50A20
MNRFIAVGAAALALVAGVAFWLNSAPTPSQAEMAFGAVNAQENSGDSATDMEDVDTSSVVEMTLGEPEAPVTLIEYASFTCPHCASFHDNQFKKLKQDYIDTGKVHFIYRDVYFDRFGLWASMVARCGGQERFFGIAEMIYDQQKDWIGNGQDPVAIADRLRKIGKVAGLDDDTLDACLKDDQWAKTLFAWYRENAGADDVTSTPTLIINGEKHSNQSYDELKDIIDAELEG